MKLGEISEIKTGIVLSRKRANSEFELVEKYKAIAIRNIEADGIFNDEPIEEFESNDELDKDYFTEEGDIIIRLSEPHTAVYIDKSKVGLLVPSQFATIKIEDSRFLPEYVAWYLNLDRVKIELLRHQTGNIMSTTNKNILSSIDIREIDRKRQEKIIKYHNLYLKEKGLLNRLIEENEKYYKCISNKLIGGN